MNGIPWTHAEQAIVIANYQDKSARQIAQMLPGRTWRGVHRQAHLLGCGKYTQPKRKRPDREEMDKQQMRVQILVLYQTMSPTERTIWRRFIESTTHELWAHHRYCMECVARKENKQ